MKSNDPLWKLLLPLNWKLLLKQTFAAFQNYHMYGNFSLNKNSPSFFNEAYSKQTKEYIPVHYHYILEFLPKDRQVSLCDFGCGTGEGLAFLSENLPLAKISAIDYSQVAINKTREKVPKAKLYCLDITKDKFPGEFDYIITIETLEHFRNPFKIAELLLNNVKEKLLISVPFNEEKDKVGRINLFAKHLYNFDENSFHSIPKSKVLLITDYIQSTKQRCIFFEIRK